MGSAANARCQLRSESTNEANQKNIYKFEKFQLRTFEDCCMRARRIAI